MKLLKLIKQNWLLLLVPILAFLSIFLFLNWLDYQFLKLTSVCQQKELIESRRITYVPDTIYSELDGVLKEIASGEYDEDDYNCVDFSADLQRRLREVGIESNLIRGWKDGQYHMWVSIYVESQSGMFISPAENYEEETCE